MGNKLFGVNISGLVAKHVAPGLCLSSSPGISRAPAIPIT